MQSYRPPALTEEGPCQSSAGPRGRERPRLSRVPARLHVECCGRALESRLLTAAQREGAGCRLGSEENTGRTGRTRPGRERGRRRGRPRGVRRRVGTPDAFALTPADFMTKRKSTAGRDPAFDTVTQRTRCGGGHRVLLRVLGLARGLARTRCSRNICR